MYIQCNNGSRTPLGAPYAITLFTTAYTVPASISVPALVTVNTTQHRKFLWS